jgi:hypothetical protein
MKPDYHIEDRVVRIRHKVFEIEQDFNEGIKKFYLPQRIIVALHDIDATRALDRKREYSEQLAEFRQSLLDIKGKLEKEHRDKLNK